MPQESKEQRKEVEKQHKMWLSRMKDLVNDY